MKVFTMPKEKRAAYIKRHMVVCGSPASAPRNALVSGNGTLMLCVTGDPAHEKLTLKREELMSPQWREAPKAPAIKEYLPEIRKTVLEGRPQVAGEKADMAAAQKGTPSTFSHNPTHPAMLIDIEQPVTKAEDYLFTLDMRTSLVTVRWDDDGIFKREAFASRADGVAAVRLSAPEGRLNALIRGSFPTLKYTRGTWSSNHVPRLNRHELGYTDQDLRDAANWLYEGVFDCQPVPPDITVAHQEQSIVVEGVYAYEQGGFSAAVRLYVQGGTVTSDAQGLHIHDASGAVMVMNARRNYGIQPTDDAQSLLKEVDAVGCDFDALHARHTAIHGAMFDRVEADLGGDPDDYLLTTVELKKKQFMSPDIVPAYMEAMLDMGRYFLLNESGKFPPIYGHVNINVNHQVSSGNIASLPEMMESFFRWIEWQLPDARENAERILGARGIFLSCHPDEEGGRLYHFNRFWPHHYWISSTGWCLNPMLEHYYCTGDEAFLRDRLLPLYRELALLYEDFLTERDDKGQLIFVPSYSPENFPSNVYSMLNVNATMDISVCRETLQALLTLGPKTDLFTQEEYAKWQDMLDHLPAYLIDEHGELKEWAWPDYEERYDHRHASHLYGAYPGDEFQPELNVELYEAAFIANRMRAMGNESCHGVMHRAQAAARLKDEWLVQKLLRFTMESGYVNDNFTTAHNPYVNHAFPDGQGALPTVLIESLLYSRPGVIEPLPAKPQGCFERGCLKGVSARTACRVDELAWDMEEGFITLALTPLKAQSVEIIYRKGFRRMTLNGQNLTEGKHANSRTVSLEENVPVLIRIEL